MNVSTTTTFLLINTRDANGTVQLPPIANAIGRSFLIKDQFANFDRSTCILQADTGDSFDTGGDTKVLNIKGQSIEIIAGADSKWHTLENSFLPSMTVITNTPTTLSSITSLKTNVIVAPAQAIEQTIQF